MRSSLTRFGIGVCRIKPFLLAIEPQRFPPLVTFQVCLLFQIPFRISRTIPEAIVRPMYILAGSETRRNLHFAMLGVNKRVFMGLDVVELATRRERARAERRSILERGSMV